MKVGPVLLLTGLNCNIPGAFYSNFVETLLRNHVPVQAVHHRYIVSPQRWVETYDQLCKMSFRGDLLTHSSSASAALRYASVYPGRVRKLVLMDPVLHERATAWDHTSVPDTLICTTSMSDMFQPAHRSGEDLYRALLPGEVTHATFHAGHSDLLNPEYVSLLAGVIPSLLAQRAPPEDRSPLAAYQESVAEHIAEFLGARSRPAARSANPIPRI